MLKITDEKLTRCRVTNSAQRQKVQRMESRARSITMYGSAPNGLSWNEHLAAYHGVTMGLEKDPEALRQVVKHTLELQRRAHYGTGDDAVEARQELCGLVIERTTNYLLSNSMWSNLFEIRTLADNESPALQNSSKNQIRARYISQDAEEPSITPVMPINKETLVDLRELVTDEVEYPLKDIYTGDVSAAHQTTFDLEFDLNGQLDDLLFTLLTSGVGNFNLTGSKAERVYVANSRIRTGILPTSNNLQIDGIGAGTKFGFPVFDKAIDYCTRFTGTDPQGDLMPDGDVYVPADEVVEIAAGMQPSNSNGAKDAIAEGLMRTGWYQIGNYKGVNWRLIPNNTLAAKKCYVKLNRPVGILWMKPGMADMEDKLDKRKNLGTRWMKICFGAAIPMPNVKNFLAIAYKT